ncbi:YybH family protein [Actinoplanes aureus]|uniref:Nuclear transport factor 2 family protein n=1 Tax=Actinoplanes aureus TaxID=2792083 RepID=A0A931CEA1_9ACTN|nr:nuclear transport factor 2 family protein [Actinoplanes aureus]MBG0564588.1 nuclear transport factor 2 family protein [Actinoplanes aureus]
MSDEKTITELIERWVAAIRATDLDGVLAGHADDIVMFDVPPPQDGVRGIDAYRETWPPFFDWIRSGSVFELVQAEVTAGADTAYAHLLLRCGSPAALARHPGHRLRITLGLCKEAGRWLIAHEHHSFPLTDAAESEREIRDLHDSWFAATAAKDLDALMAPIATDVVSYEHETPLAYTGRDQVREVCRRGLEAGAGEVTWQVPDLTVVTDGDLAVAWGLNRVRADGAPETWSRGTRVFRRAGGRWEMVHQHLSYPLEPATGEARTDLKP